MKMVDILKQAENLANDEEKLSFLAKFIGDNYDELETRDFIQLLTPLVDITKRMYEHEQNQDTLSDYSTALTKLAEYYIKDEQTWKATPLLEKAKELLRECADSEENAPWKFNTYSQIAECYTTNQHRPMAKKAYQQALLYATSEEDKEDCEYSLNRLENPTLRYDPIEDSEVYLSVIDEVECRLHEELKGEPRHMGFCFRYWSAKRDLLAEYGIEWRSPGVMNPRVIFD